MVYKLAEIASLSGGGFDSGKDLDLNHLDVAFDESAGVLWNFVRADSTPHFSHEQLDDIRHLQNFVRDSFSSQQSTKLCSPIRYVVFGSNRPGVFSLGGDLDLFARLITDKNRAEMWNYARKATDAVYYHASSGPETTSISLVEGIAMGGGFEAALAGNLLVAEEGTKLGFPEVLFGLFPGMGAYTLLRRKVSARVAEEVILSAKNYSAEELHGMGIVDVLAKKGEGRKEVRSYVSRNAHRAGTAAFRRALYENCAPDREELYGICDSWVNAAMNVSDSCLRRIGRLVGNQRKSYGYQTEERGTVELEIAV